MEKINFAAFILSHGRPDNIKTIPALQRSGYTGKVFIIIDDQDKTREKYLANFGDQVIIFNKAEIAKEVDHGDNFNDLRTTTHVRNAIFKEAKKRKIPFFVQLDDDYTDFRYSSDENNRYINTSKVIQNLDKMFANLVDFQKATGCKSVCFSQGGDFIGGKDSSFINHGLRRKAMNSFVCATDNKFQFFSRLNEDVNTYLRLGFLGDLFFTVTRIRLSQAITQSSKGGMTETYIDNGTYVKSFYTVMFMPSCTKVSTMGNTAETQRLHHKITWNSAVPKIISQKHKKK